MATRAYRPPNPYEDVPLRRRASGLGMAIGLNLLVLFILLGLSAQISFAPVTKGGIKTFDVSDDNENDRKKRSDQSVPPPRPQPKTHRPVVAPPITLPAPVVPPAQLDSQLVELTRSEIASADRAVSEASSGGSRGDDSQVVGKGPNGEDLYAAEWYRRPTDQELSYYLPKNAMDGYGMIACKTLPDYRVGDCVALESKPGHSHLAGAVLNAAWQFKVRPPRKNGKPLIGEWVRIRIDYTTVGSR